MPEAGSSRQAEVLEEGDIFFLYRPRVEEEDPSKLADVQRFFIVLRPSGGKHSRLITVGRKRLPEIGRHERNWGFVALVTDDERKIERELREETYETETRGERHQPAARPAGEGVYVISLEDGQMHLSYALELPESPGEVQDALKIRNKASYVLAVKNPERGAPPGVGLGAQQKADYPDRLQEIFRGRRLHERTCGCSIMKAPKFCSSAPAPTRAGSTASSWRPSRRRPAQLTFSASSTWPRAATR